MSKIVSKTLFGKGCENNICVLLGDREKDTSPRYGVYEGAEF